MTGSIGGHALIALSSVITTVQFFATTQSRGWVLRLMDREPIVFFSLCLTGAALALPCVVPEARRRMGLPTDQYDGYTPTK
eukprot:CAMPEP_0118888776 /NCGR_PEP_ID=MMETSP1166-20130328/14_1 /TAXON_ID=1104430 /ORGANISM="Chrysoreinhardia sp, Strain CCMP3193" /LENGTH=80 /DNA_ID=CAMNT_0006827349 /DNA_START=60 /DNA_END=302 /DNA_ORIENTATION=+